MLHRILVWAPVTPQPSPLMLRHPIAGHALGLGDLVGGHAFGHYNADHSSGNQTQQRPVA